MAISIYRRLVRRFVRVGMTTVQIGESRLAIPRVTPHATIYSDDPEYSDQLRRIGQTVLEEYPDAIVVDVGANVGDSVALLRKSIDAPIVCIEGDPKVYRILQRNLKQFRSVASHLLLVGEHDATAFMDMQSGGWNMTLQPAKTVEGTEIKLRCLDSLLPEICDQSRVKLIKIDAEGFDLRIIRGARRLLGANRPVLFFEYNRSNLDKLGDDGLSIFWLLSDLGYSHIFFYDARGRLLICTTLEERETITQLHRYCDGHRSLTSYYDVCVFHNDDAALARRFGDREEEYRQVHSGPREI